MAGTLGADQVHQPVPARQLRVGQVGSGAAVAILPGRQDGGDLDEGAVLAHQDRPCPAVVRLRERDAAAVREHRLVTLCRSVEREADLAGNVGKGRVDCQYLAADDTGHEQAS